MGKNNLVEEGFSGYLQDETKISFPWSMIDKITPRPDSKIKEMLERTGLEGMDIFTTSANTYIAPFVNAEETEYLVIEDNSQMEDRSWSMQVFCLQIAAP